MHHSCLALRHGCPSSTLLDRLEPRRLFAPTPVAGNKGVFTDVDGDLVTVQLTGPGTLGISEGSGDHVFAAVVTTATTDASKLSISVKKVGAGNGQANIGAFQCDASLKSILAPTVNLTSDFSDITGFVGEFKVRDILNSDITVHGAVGTPQTLRFSARLIESTSVARGAPVDANIIHLDTLHVSSFSATAMRQSRLFAGAIDTFKISGGDIPNDFDFGSVECFGLVGVANTIGKFTITGDVEDVAINISGRVNAVTVGLFHAGITADGDIGSFTCTSDFHNGNLRAAFFGAVAIRGGLNDNSKITATGANAEGLSIRSIKFARGDRLFIEAPNGSQGPQGVIHGRIGSITAIDMAKGQVTASSIGPITTKGSKLAGIRGDLDLDMRLPDANRAQSLDRLSAKGLLAGESFVAGNIGAISALGIADGFSLAVGTIDTEIDTLPAAGLPVSPEFSGHGGVIASLSIPKPPASAGFGVGTPNLGEYWIECTHIAKLTLFVGFAKTTSPNDTQFGIAAIQFDNSTISTNSATFKSNNFNAASLQVLAASNPSVPIVVTAQHVETGLADDFTLIHGRLRFFL